MANCFINLQITIFYIYFLSNWLIHCHICDKKFRLGQFAWLTRYLLWSFLSLRPLWGLCSKTFDTLFSKQFSIFFFQSNWIILGHICNKMFSSSQYALLARYLICLFEKYLIRSFIKFRDLTRVLWQIVFKNFLGNCCSYISQSNWLILGHFCNMMLSSSQFAILGRSLIYILKKLYI